MGLPSMLWSHIFQFDVSKSMRPLRRSLRRRHGFRHWYLAIDINVIVILPSVRRRLLFRCCPTKMMNDLPLPFGHFSNRTGAGLVIYLCKVVGWYSGKLPWRKKKVLKSLCWRKFSFSCLTATNTGCNLEVIPPKRDLPRVKNKKSQECVSFPCGKKWMMSLRCSLLWWSSGTLPSTELCTEITPVPFPCAQMWQGANSSPS